MVKPRNFILPSFRISTLPFNGRVVGVKVPFERLEHLGSVVTAQNCSLWREINFELMQVKYWKYW
jgi:hypothetical protein